LRRNGGVDESSWYLPGDQAVRDETVGHDHEEQGQQVQHDALDEVVRHLCKGQGQDIHQKVKVNL
jgi:hypothetical protein